MGRIVLEGRPGVGKTTVALRLVAELRPRGVEVGGFVTRELREGGRRVGFEAEDLAGGRAVLAHVGLPGPPRVGRYGLDLAAFEAVALPALERPAEVLVVDEIGRMELASARFRAVLPRLFAPEGPTIVATARAGADPLIDELLRHPGVEVVHVTEANRGQLPERLVARLIGLLRGPL